MARRVSKKPPAKRAAKSAARAKRKAAPRRKAARLAVHVASPSAASPPAAASAPAGVPSSRQPAWRAGLLAEMSRGLQRVDATLEPAEPAPTSRAGKAAHKELRASLRSALERLSQQIEATKGG